MEKLFIGVAVVATVISLIAVKGIENYAPVHTGTACSGGTCVTVRMSTPEARKLCEGLGDMVAVRPDSPCGRLLAQ